MGYSRREKNLSPGEVFVFRRDDPIARKAFP